jgi:hypothetical protein
MKKGRPPDDGLDHFQTNLKTRTKTTGSLLFDLMYQIEGPCLKTIECFTFLDECRRKVGPNFFPKKTVLLVHFVWKTTTLSTQNTQKVYIKTFVKPKRAKKMKSATERERTVEKVVKFLKKKQILCHQPLWLDKRKTS